VPSSETSFASYSAVGSYYQNSSIPWLYSSFHTREIAGVTKQFRSCCVCGQKAVGSVLIIVPDGRALFASEANAEVPEYNALATAINERYASRHGYDFAYYTLPDQPCDHMADSERCKYKHRLFHPELKAHRALPWLKLLAVWHGLTRGYDWVVSIDSDAVFRNHALGIEELLSAMDGGSDVLVLSDMPWRYLRACTGFLIVRGGAYGMSIIKHWWDFGAELPWSLHSTRHPFDQGAFDSLVSTTGPIQVVLPAGGAINPKFNERFARRCVRVEVSQFYLAQYNFFTVPLATNRSHVMHIDHNAANFRMAVLTAIMHEVGASLDDLVARRLGLTVELDTDAVAKEIAAWTAPRSCAADIALDAVSRRREDNRSRL